MFTNDDCEVREVNWSNLIQVTGLAIPVIINRHNQHPWNKGEEIGVSHNNLVVINTTSITAETTVSTNDVIYTGLFNTRSVCNKSSLVKDN